MPEPELHQTYGSLRRAADKLQRDGRTVNLRKAATLVLRGVGFADRYARFYDDSQKRLYDEVNVDGSKPFVGLNLSRLVDLGTQAEKDSSASLCPRGMESVSVMDWYVGDRYLAEGNGTDLVLRGYRRLHGKIVGQTVLWTSTQNVFETTELMVSMGFVDVPDHP